jgi:hypothetical protein
MIMRAARGEEAGITADDLTTIVHQLTSPLGDGTTALEGTTPMQRVGLCAAATVALCNARRTTDLDACLDQALPFCQLSETATSQSRLRSHARSVAGHLWAMLHQNIATGTPRPDVPARIAHALDASVELACVQWTTATGNETPSATVCEDAALFSTPREAVAVTARGPRMLMRGARVLHAFLEDDSTDAAFEASELVMDVLVFQFADSIPTDRRRPFARALRLLGGLLTYAETYREVADDSDLAAGHEERRQILESLSAEFTNRNERRGDWIVSLGGSLRLNAGARFHNPEGTDIGAAFWGPASLVLGFGVDLVPNPVGLHLEVGLFDLGQYLDFGDGVTLRTPSPAAAVSPSLTIAISFLGPQVPLFLGVTFGASPFPAEQTASDPGRRVLYLGGVAGFYVPLFDLN